MHQNRQILNPDCSPADLIFVLLCAAGKREALPEKATSEDWGRNMALWPLTQEAFPFSYPSFICATTWPWVCRGTGVVVECLSHTEAIKMSSDASAGLSLGCTQKPSIPWPHYAWSLQSHPEALPGLPWQSKSHKIQARNKLQASPAPFFLGGWDPLEIHTHTDAHVFMPSLSSPSGVPNIYVKDNSSKRKPLESLTGVVTRLVAKSTEGHPNL